MSGGGTVAISPMRGVINQAFHVDSDLPGGLIVFLF